MSCASADRDQVKRQRVGHRLLATIRCLAVNRRRLFFRQPHMWEQFCF
ncbi:MAG: hypothetical protein ONB16_07355 [candidate division KSB1 bacterium]|nr:hypothetical protein [candidate division KSB1 bacterium]MDZ7340875.1 hypothetical protein [candidate division KSB1 bacterium]